MKITLGFVSNSSTTSFNIYGVIVDGDFTSETFLNEYFGEESFTKYLGVEWENMKGDETKKQFMERIDVEIQRLLGENYKGDYYSESYRDG